MAEITIDYTLADGTKAQWQAYALNNVGAFTDFLLWCVEQGLQPVAMSASRG